MSEFVAVDDAIKVFLDSLKLSVNLNSVDFGLMKSLEEATTFPNEYHRFLPGLKDAKFAATGQADFADDANNELLYARLSTEGHIVSIGVGGADPGDVAYFYKSTIENFDPLKGEPGKVSSFNFSLKKYASVPVIRGLILENGTKVYSTPTAPVAALASPAAPGNIDNGTHSYKVTFVNALGESAPSPTSNVITIVDKTVNGQATVTIQVGPTGTTSRKVYRRIAGDTGNWKLLATVANNTATSYTDNIADSGLGANAPATGTYISADPEQLGTVPVGKQLYAALHVIEAGTGTLTVTLQSDNGSGFPSPATVFSFTAATGLTQEIKNTASNLDSWYRITFTISGGSGWQFFVAVGYAK